MQFLELIKYLFLFNKINNITDISQLVLMHKMVQLYLLKELLVINIKEQ